MPIYSIEFTMHATAYIRADSEEEAKTIAQDHKGGCFEDASGELFSELALDDPDLPDFSFSPAMTIGKPDLDHVEEAG